MEKESRNVVFLLACVLQ